MSENLRALLQGILGKKRLELLEFLCENADENGFVMIKISDLEEKLKQSKPTIIATFKFLEEKKLFKRLKNGFYQLNL
ncbi:replication/maintenance protein RepL [Campylobacter helveticus]|uniref:ArsR family transcriptional regulator n=1 Tax=Campylobacter helveticus TaxID=28898 RepID=A0ABY3L207_9BACT|nr:replication/maintenance protein RepL [Campylobacter helveticus]MCR2038989.1 replication/maintenance protein RepL [Campylobacter helveticus]MCR2059404.1 replication/maintenance protein RepL [Campylobacter helveticus]MCR2061948.1 replication/maintenance protein RepL [Campylobacter helveticus]QBL12217.1 ArsR family transcriptional regulator [Campylobacter helveticus]TNB64295.1 ArsR family transcriptional regulator [Campylobacter helveticus]